jgi:hypothetical protein
MSGRFETGEIGGYLDRHALTFERFRMSKKTVTRLFVGAIAAFGVGLALGLGALWAALASDAVDFGGSHVIDVNGGSGAWTALGLVLLGSLVILGGTIAGVLSWVGALLDTWQLEDKAWFAALLALGLLGFGIVAMIAYVVAGPDGTNKGTPRAPSKRTRPLEPQARARAG